MNRIDCNIWSFVVGICSTRKKSSQWIVDLLDLHIATVAEVPVGTMVMIGPAISGIGS